MAAANRSDGESVPFIPHTIVFVANAEIQSQSRRDFPVILEEQVPVVLVGLGDLSMSRNAHVVIPMQILRLLEEVILEHLVDRSRLEVKQRVCGGLIRGHESRQKSDWPAND